MMMKIHVNENKYEEFSCWHMPKTRGKKTQKEKRDNSEREKEVKRAAEETIVDSQSSRNNSHGS